MKSILLAVAILLVAAFIITGCGTSTPTATTPAATITPTGPGPATIAPIPTTSVVKTTSTTPAASTTVSTSPKASASSAAGQAKYGGTLTWILASGPAGPIGYIPEVTGPSGVTPIISFETLLKEMLDGTLNPGLAASWDVDSTPTSPSVTFHLQQGVKFSDGTDFNAAAVKWNFDNCKKTAYYASSTSKWKSIEVIDNNTVKINFTTWQNTLLRSFADSGFYLESPTAFEKNGIDWARYHMVGTGPFLQKDYQKDVILSGTRNPNYWQTGKPYLDGVKYVFVADDLTSTALFKSGGADVITTSNLTTLKDLAAAGNNVVSFANGPFTLVPDGANADSPWSSLLVRQAAEYAIDKVALANAFGYGSQPAYQFCNPSSKAYDPSITGRGNDLAKAKQLMAQAGYPNGFKTTITAGPTYLNKDAVVAVQAYLAKIGIQADLQFPPASSWSQMQMNPWHNGLLWMPINTSGNPNVTFTYFLASPPVLDVSIYQPDGWGALLSKSMTAPQVDLALLKQIENTIYDKSMLIPMYYGANYTVFAPYVKDSGQGTRGQSNWWEPQNTWLNK